MKMLPSFLLALLTFFALDFGAFKSERQNVEAALPSEVIQIVGNKSLHRTPQFGYVIFNFHPNSKLEVAENAREFHAQSYKQCLVTCASNKTCLSINFGKQTIFFYQGKAQYLCELLPTDKYNSSTMYQSPHPDFNHYSIRSNCSTSPCLHNFTCIPDYDNDTYECSCPRPPFEGKHCKDVDECTTGQHNCSVNADCTNTIGSFNCRCKDGYLGNGRNCTDIDECASHPCKNGGSCQQDQVNSYTCTCAAGFTGDNCQIDIDECASNPCQNGGSCQDQVNSYTCTCAAGFTGVNCQIDIDECASNPCQNGRLCYDRVNSYICRCPHGFTGVNCQTDVDECTTGQHNCSVNATCTNTIGSFNCRNCTELKFALDSEILRDYGNVSYHAALKTFMCQVLEDIVNTSWIRCWSGKNDGFDVNTTFHPQCDGKGATVTIVRKNQYIMGGYTDVPWSSPTPSGISVYKTSTKSFIFSLHNIRGFNPQRFDIVDTTKAVFHNSIYYGPAFGGTKDLKIHSHASSSKYNRNKPYAYAIPPGCVYDKYCNFFTGIADSYTIDDIEVFYKNTV